VLDEWSTGVRRTIKLETKHYGKIYNAILNGLETVDQHEYYGPLLHQRLAAWAGFGESVSLSSPHPVPAVLILLPGPLTAPTTYQPVFLLFISTSLCQEDSSHL
jgi:hypothetical protein